MHVRSLGGGVAENLAQRLVSVDGTMGENVEPGDMLLVDRARLVIAYGPIQEVLERPGECPREPERIPNGESPDCFRP